MRSIALGCRRFRECRAVRAPEASSKVSLLLISPKNGSLLQFLPSSLGIDEGRVAGTLEKIHAFLDGLGQYLIPAAVNWVG